MDYYSKQYQAETNTEMRLFFKQTREAGRAKSEATDRIKIQLLADLSRCQSNAAKTNSNYLQLIQKHLTNKSAKALQNNSITDEANVLLNNMRNECRAIYDEKMKEGM